MASFTSIWPWLLAAWLVHIGLLSVWIILEKREPAATISWLLGLALIPVLGFVCYYFLGPQRIRRQRLKRMYARAALARQHDRISHANDPEFAGGLNQLVSAATGYEASSCTEMDLLVGGEEAFDALLAAIGKARHHVHLEYYIFEPDKTGTALRDLLIDRAKQGVRVRLLLDAMGASGLGRAFLRPLREAGVELAWFHPIRLSRLWRPRWNFRTHRKIVVIDGQLGFTGGINVTDEQDSRRSSAAYVDIHMRLRGEIVRWLQLAFLEHWHYATGIALSDESMWTTETGGSISAQVVPSGPDNPTEPLHLLKVHAIHSAAQRVWLATPYFVPGEAALMALSAAAMRGVDVRLLVPDKSDSRVVTAAARSYFTTLLEVGVRIFEYQPGMMHAKAMLVDDDCAIVGSANFDHRSFRLNYELSVMFRDAGASRALEETLEKVIEDSSEVRLPRRITRLQQFEEALARLASPML